MTNTAIGTGRDVAYTGSVPDLYYSLLVPMIFDAYAADLANRVAAFQPSRVL